eukprot:EG_transcript_18805
MDTGGDEEASANHRKQRVEPRKRKAPKEAAADKQQGPKRATPQKKPRTTQKEGKKGAVADMAYPGSATMFAGIARRSPRDHKAPVTGFLPTDADELDPFAIVGTVPFPGRQPFAVEVCNEAMMLADLHAHMMQTEVIGYLAGTYDAAKAVLRVRFVFPGKPLVSGDHEVELDPASEVAMKEKVAHANVDVVGWYHSHPTFAPEPSVRDVQNHNSYQTLFHSHGPFIGCIVSPYGLGKGPCASMFRWFLTEDTLGGTTCRRLDACVAPLAALESSGDFSAALKAQVRELVEELRGDPNRWNWMTDWDDTTVKSAVHYRTITCLCKAITSMYGHTVAALRPAL